MKLNPADIIVPEERQRKDLGDIGDIANSFVSVGQINPITITKSNTLIAGERRLRAALSLEWPEIEVRYLEDMTPAQLHLIELEENIKRKQLEWPEQVAAMKQYHELKVAANPEHTELDTSIELGVSSTTVFKDIQLANDLQANPKLKDVKKKRQAYEKSRRKAQREQAVALDIDLDTGVVAAPLMGAEGRGLQLINTDFTKWLADYTGPLFDFIHCDFPYGINLDKAGEALRNDAHSIYDDSLENSFHLNSRFREFLPLITKPNAVIMFWYAPQVFDGLKEFFLDRLCTHPEFSYHPVPLIWHKKDDKGISSDYRRRPRHVYETAIVIRRGDPGIFTTLPDLVSANTTNLLHRSEKPREVLRHFFRMFVDKDTNMLDPTCGSGNALYIAEEFNCRATGIEIDTEIYEAAKKELNL